MDIVTSRSWDAYELADAFRRFFKWIEKYYKKEQIKNFREWHTSESLEWKIDDPTRFFRVVRDDFGDIIAYFESRGNPEEKRQSVQWFLVDPKYRKNWILKSIWQDFEAWCRKNEYSSIWSVNSLENKVSEEVHRRLWMEKTQIWPYWQESEKNL